jgi:DNA repair exonuclease SbcCD ATPase subunit
MNYCLTTKTGFKTYFLNKKRVSKSEFYKRYPNFDVKECILIGNKKDLKQDIEVVNSIKEELVKCIYSLEKSNRNYDKLNEMKKEEYYPIILKLKKEILKYKTKIEDLNVSTQNYNKELIEKQKTITSLLQDVKNGKLDNEKLIKSILSFEIANEDLKGQLSECNKRNEEIKDELRDVKNSLNFQPDKNLKDELEKQIRTLNDKLILSENQKRTLIERISKKENELKEAIVFKDRDEVTRLKKELGEFNVESVVKLKNDLEESKKRVQELESYLINKAYDSYESYEDLDQEEKERQKIFYCIYSFYSFT